MDRSEAARGVGRGGESQPEGMRGGKDSLIGVGLGICVERSSTKEGVPSLIDQVCGSKSTRAYLSTTPLQRTHFGHGSVVSCRHAPLSFVLTELLPLPPCRPLHGSSTASQISEGTCGVCPKNQPWSRG